MDIKDLAIGNWVYYDSNPNSPTRVVNIGSYSVSLEYYGREGYVFVPSVEDIQPIEVTDDILENSGFKLAGQVLTSEKVYKYSVFHFILNKIYIQVKHDSPERKYHCLVSNLDGIPVGQFCFDYVHELQNGIRLITKQDLDVKL